MYLGLVYYNSMGSSRFVRQGNHAELVAGCIMITALLLDDMRLGYSSAMGQCMGVASTGNLAGSEPLSTTTANTLTHMRVSAVIILWHPFALRLDG